MALALTVFLLFNIYGIKENGLGGYSKHLGGPFWTKYMWPLAIFFFALETLSITLRILTLNLRLYWNIKADHMVLEVFTDMTKLIVPHSSISWVLSYR